jgi:hypothetical protein
VPLGALLGVLATFAKNSATLNSHGAALFRIAIEAVAADLIGHSADSEAQSL